jgi:deazaflavin-dependent oxidoreductase (nitroreductase family)
MTESLKAPTPPTGLSRLLFRAPIWFYRVGLGWLLGKRFLLLNHIGRKSGLTRQATLEVPDYDKETDTYFIAAGFGPRSDWFRNLQQTPDVTIQVGRRKLAVTAGFLTPEESGQKMVDYARKYPFAARNLIRFLGHRVDGTEASYRALGRDVIPFVALRPREQAQEQTR